MESGTVGGRAFDQQDAAFGIGLGLLRARADGQPRRDMGVDANERLMLVRWKERCVNSTHGR